MTFCHGHNYVFDFNEISELSSCYDQMEKETRNKQDSQMPRNCEHSGF